MQDTSQRDFSPPKRKRRSTKPRTPRQIDPGVAEIRARAAEEVRQYHKAKASAGVLKRIVEKELDRLTFQDQGYLLERLHEIVKKTPT